MWVSLGEILSWGWGGGIRAASGAITEIGYRTDRQDKGLPGRGFLLAPHPLLPPSSCTHPACVLTPEPQPGLPFQRALLGVMCCTLPGSRWWGRLSPYVASLCSDERKVVLPGWVFYQRMETLEEVHSVFYLFVIIEYL